MKTIYVDLLEGTSLEGENASCETCGHWSRNELIIYSDMDNDDEILVEYIDEVSCTGGWLNFDGTVQEFKVWLADNNQFFLSDDLVKIEEALERVIH